MISKIVPNIFALTKEEFDKKLTALEFSKEIHLDFMDGRFTRNKSLLLKDMKLVKKSSNKKFNIHLMAYEPLKCLEKIKSLKIEKVYVQFEVYASDFKLQYDIKQFKENKIQIGIALNPSTSVNAIAPFLNSIDSVMIMSVYPGEEKQEFIEYTLSKIRDLRNLGYKKEISFDGGINDSNTKQIIDHGANTLYVGSYITSNGDANPKENFNKLKELIKITNLK